MASANEVFIRKWIEANCPNFLSQFASPPRFVVLETTGNAGAMKNVFMSSSATSWESHTKFGDILTECTIAGRDVLAEIATARVQSAYTMGKNYIFGPGTIVASTRGNLASSGTMKTRMDAFRTNPANSAAYAKAVADRNAWVAAHNTTPWSDSELEAWSKTTFVKFMKDMALSAGVVEMSEPIIVQHPDGSGAHFSKYLDDIFKLIGPGRVFARFELTAVTPWRSIIMHFPKMDDSVATVSFDPRDTPSTNYGLDAFTLGTLTLNEKWTGAAAAVAALNPAYSPAQLISMNSVTKVDDYYLPLVSLPGSFEVLVRSPWDTTSVTAEDLGDMSITHVNCSGPDVIGSIPISWYRDYVVANSSSATNTVAMEEALVALEEHADKTITFVGYENPVFLEQNMIELTQLYRDYKKAKEKACEENDFMSLQFTTQMTYGNLQTLINGSRSTRVFYGRREVGEVSVIPEAVGLSRVGWTLTGGTATVTVRRPNGTYAPSYTEATGEQFLQDIARGATLTGTTVDGQLALWGFDASTVSDAYAGLDEAYDAAEEGLVIGSPTAAYDFRWESLGITGYPDVKVLTDDPMRRVVMASKGAIAPLGSKLRDLLFEQQRDYYASYVYK